MSDAKNQNWQKRQYDSFGPHFRIETANPELGGAGNIAYNLYGYSDSKDCLLYTSDAADDC